KLAVQRPDFAPSTLNLIIDTFNDEAEEVRLQAIQSMLTIVNTTNGIEITMEHFESVLSMLDDSQYLVRITSRTLLSKISLPYSNDALIRTVRCLYAALLKYPTDELDVFKCLSLVGSKHATLVDEC